eukprot:gnl/MRDRNA2_/MRDRNA2_100180_c0_seq1.p1 gnl/MRDRNA2_/MRDRNA2_100180_c0~~gnl/MRDRNA2_/MRDRNA2_100180_c0_seq1.p1  ORF type:complete len:719 (+),score=195.73 gnl/MRDRNA2_/MRDRNA2_100180_c0_seq1:59-2215(+)
MATGQSRAPLAALEVENLFGRTISSESVESESGASLGKYLPESSAIAKSNVVIRNPQIDIALKSWYKDCEVYDDSENVNCTQLPKTDVVSETLKGVRSAAEIVNEATRTAEANLGLEVAKQDAPKAAESPGEALQQTLTQFQSELFEARRLLEEKSSMCIQLEAQVAKVETTAESEMRHLHSETSERNTYIIELEQEKTVLRTRLRKLCDRSQSPEKAAHGALEAAQEAAERVEAALTQRTANLGACVVPPPEQHLQECRQRIEELEAELSKACSEIQCLHADEAQRRDQRCGACSVLRQQLAHASSQGGEAQAKAQCLQEELSQLRKNHKAAESSISKLEVEEKVQSEQLAAAKQALDEHRNSQDVAETRWREEIATWVAFYEDAKAALERSQHRRDEAEKFQKTCEAQAAELRAQVRCLTEEVQSGKESFRNEEGTCKKEIAEAKAEMRADLDALQSNLAEERRRAEAAAASQKETQQRLQESEHQQAGLIEVSDERWRRCAALQDKIERLQAREIAEQSSRMPLLEELHQAEARLMEIDRRHRSRRDQASSPMSDRVLLSMQTQLDDRISRVRQLEDEVKDVQQMRARDEQAFQEAVGRLRSKVEKHRLGHLELQRLYQERSRLQNEAAHQPFDLSGRGRVSSHGRSRIGSPEPHSRYASRAIIEPRMTHNRGHQKVLTSPSGQSTDSTEKVQGSSMRSEFVIHGNDSSAIYEYP